MESAGWPGIIETFWLLTYVLSDVEIEFVSRYEKTKI